MKLPSLEDATALMDEAETRNPGPWVSHSRHVAEAARFIANDLPGLDPQAAFIVGYLHDIGRREGVSGMRHILDGYFFLSHQGYETAARICMTHSFPLKDVRAIVGTWNDCSRSEVIQVQEYLDRCDYDAYDKLIQLCDSLAMPSGFCLIEKRLVDVTLRYGTNEYTLPRWKAYFAIQNEFEKILNKSIYSCLPGIMENTLNTNLLSQHGN